MAIRLQKGQTIQLEKSQYNLSKVTLGLGWRVNENKGFLAGLFGSTAEYDLDAIAFLLNKDGKVQHLGNRLDGGDVVFFNNLKHFSGSVWSCGDNLVGGTGESEDEQIVCLLNKVPEWCERILFLVSIYQGQERKQSFGNVKNAYIRAVDGNGVEMARYELSDEEGAADAQSVIFAELYRRNGGWKLRAIGEPRKTASFIDILKDYLYE